MLKKQVWCWQVQDVTCVVWQQFLQPACAAANGKAGVILQLADILCLMSWPPDQDCRQGDLHSCQVTEQHADAVKVSTISQQGHCMLSRSSRISTNQVHHADAVMHDM